MSLKSLSVTIGADTSGFSEGMRAVTDGIKNTQETAAKASKSLASQAASLASEYKKQGMNASEAFKKAWSEIEHNTEKSNQTTSKNASFGLKSVFSQFKSSAKSANSGMEGFNSSLSESNRLIPSLSSGMKSLTSVAKKLGAVILTTFSVRAIINFSKECKSLYQIQADGEIKLETIMRQRMNATSETVQSIKDYASALQESGVIGDEVQLAGAQQVATFLNQADSLKILMPAMNNLLAQQNGLNSSAQDAVSIGNLLGKAMQGQVGALTRVGITFSEAEEQVLKYGNESERASTLAKVITNNVGEMNQVLAKTDLGRQQQLSNTLGDIKEQFGSAVTQIEVLFLPALKKVADTLGNIATFAQSLSRAFADIFGTSESKYIGTASGIASSANDASESYENMAESAEKTATANKKSLAGFDELNVLSKSTDDNTNDTADTNTGNNTIPISSQVIKVEADTNPLTKNLTEIFGKVTEILNPVRESLSNLWKALEPLKNFVADGLVNFYNKFLVPVGNWTLGTGLPKFIDSLSSGISNIDWNKINSNFERLWQALSPFAVNIGEGLLWFWDNVLVPLGTWSFNNLLPFALSSLSSVIEILNAVIEGFKPMGEWLWNNFIKPVSEWVGNIITSGLENLANALESIAKWCDENKTSASIIFGLSVAVTALSSAVKSGSISNFFTKLGTGIKAIGKIDVTVGTIVAGIAGWVYAITEIYKNWDDIISVIEQDGGIFNFIGNWIDSCRQDIENFFNNLPLGKKWYDFWSKVGETVYTVLSKVPKSVVIIGKNIISGLYKGISKAFKNAKKWVKENIVDPFINGFKSLFGIHSPSTVMAELGGYIVAGLYNAISAGISQITSVFREILTSIKNEFSGIDEWFKEIFSTASENIKEIFGGIGEWFSGRWDDITSIFSGTGEWFSEKFQSAYNNITEIFSGIGEWFYNKWNDITSELSEVDVWFKNKFKSAYDNVVDSFKNIGTWFSDSWKSVKIALSEVNSWFKSKFQKAYDNIKNIFKNIGSWFSGKWHDIKNALSDVPDWFKSKFKSARDNITNIFSDIGSWFSNRWNDITAAFSEVGEWFRDIFQNAWNNITGIFSGIGNWFSNRWNDVTTALSNIGEWFKETFQTAWNNITGIFSDAGNWFSNRWEDITIAFSGVGDWFSEQFQSAYNNITEIFSGLGNWFGSIWENVSDGAKEGLNWIIGKINDMISKLNSFSFEMPGFLGGGTVGFDIPEIQYLAKGGVVNSPTIAMIGESGKEAVLPLQNNTGWITDISSKLWDSMKYTLQSILPRDNNQTLKINILTNIPKTPKIEQPAVKSPVYNYKYETYNMQRNLYTNQTESQKQNNNLPPVNVYLYPNSRAFKRDVLNAYREEIARGGKIA